jgi:hypothetical protein
MFDATGLQVLDWDDCLRLLASVPVGTSFIRIPIEIVNGRRLGDVTLPNGRGFVIDSYRAAGT